ncbi:hypothetical protein HY256_03265 [Candidatus Sumerlaeota bacterium]|nr:hypothetical protein [Candidatus Sumerlaeota bacterium]
MTARAEEQTNKKHDRYFLSLNQKTELIRDGVITGEDGTVYDVRVVPGYAEPVREGRDRLNDAGANLGKYADIETYKRVGEAYKNGTGFLARDVAKECWIEGIGNAWSGSFADANEATRHQVIGWPFAYPWAVAKSTGETAGRLAFGTVEAGAGSAFFYAIQPAYELLSPTVKGSVEGIGGGVALPAAEVALNTAVAPPIALAGRVPTPERVDGYFVRIVPGAPAVGPTSQLLEMREELSVGAKSPVENANLAASSEGLGEPVAATQGCCAFADQFLEEYYRQQLALYAADAYFARPQM